MIWDGMCGMHVPREWVPTLHRAGDRDLEGGTRGGDVIT